MYKQFFKALTKTALNNWAAKSNDEDTNYGWSPRAGIDATIEALKEMMVGEPLKRVIESDGKNHTWIMNEDRGVTLHFWGVHGADGEEVVVLCLKRRSDQA